jgi:hypothetical protein
MTDQPPDQPGPQPEQPSWGQPAGPPPWGQPGTPGQPTWGQPPGPPGPPSPYGPSQYGQPVPYAPYGPLPPQTSGRATTVLVLGIVSLVTLFTCGIGFVPAIIALVMAPGAKAEIATSGGRLTGESQVRTGTVLSWVTIGLTALAVVLLVLVVGLAIAVGEGSGSGGQPSPVRPG